jgi:hypothetical protein
MERPSWLAAPYAVLFSCRDATQATRTRIGAQHSAAELRYNTCHATRIGSALRAPVLVSIMTNRLSPQLALVPDSVDEDPNPESNKFNDEIRSSMKKQITWEGRDANECDIKVRCSDGIAVNDCLRTTATRRG